MSKQKAKIRLLLTNRALADVASIEAYSIDTWGRGTAAKYIDDIQAAFDRLKKNPGLLRSETGFHASLQFYSVNKHVIACNVHGNDIFVLTLLHGSLDIPSRLNELAPTLAIETEMLHEQLKSTKKRRT